MLNLETEKQIFSQGYNLLGSIDEAGRGPLAGPVVAAMVMVPPEFDIEKNSDLKQINDSKKLSFKKRDKLAVMIKETFSVGIGVCDNKIIDRINILQASFLAMKKAISDCNIKPDFIALDGKMKIPNLSCPQKNIIKGDSSVFSIAAASIIAKVVRDEIMQEFHEIYPDYCFDCHKGYGTKLHIEKIYKFGPCPIHRYSFKPIKNVGKFFPGHLTKTQK